LDLSYDGAAAECIAQPKKASSASSRLSAKENQGGGKRGAKKSETTRSAPIWCDDCLLNHDI